MPGRVPEEHWGPSGVEDCKQSSTSVSYSMSVSQKSREEFQDNCTTILEETKGNNCKSQGLSGNQWNR